MVTRLGSPDGNNGGTSDTYYSVTTTITPSADVRLRGITMTSNLYVASAAIEIDDVLVSGPSANSNVFTMPMDVQLLKGRTYKIVYHNQGARVRIHRTMGIPVYPILGILTAAPEYNTVASPSYEFEFDDIPVVQKSEFNLVDDEAHLIFGFAMDARKGRWLAEGMGFGAGGGGGSLIAADRVYYGDLLIADNT